MQTVSPFLYHKNVRLNWPCICKLDFRKWFAQLTHYFRQFCILLWFSNIDKIPKLVAKWCGCFNKTVEKSYKPYEGDVSTTSAIVIDFPWTAFDLMSWSVRKPQTNVRHDGRWKQSFVWLRVWPLVAFTNVGKRPWGRVKQFLSAAGGETEVRAIKRDLGQGHTSAATPGWSARRRREDILWRSHGQMIW